MTYKPIDKKGSGKQSTSTGYGPQDITSPKDRGGDVPTITRKGTGKKETSSGWMEPTGTGHPGERTQDVAGVEKRSYSYKTNTSAKGRRVNDGVGGLREKKG